MNALRSPNAHNGDGIGGAGGRRRRPRSPTGGTMSLFSSCSFSRNDENTFRTMTNRLILAAFISSAAYVAITFQAYLILPDVTYRYESDQHFLFNPSGEKKERLGVVGVPGRRGTHLSPAFAVVEGLKNIRIFRKNKGTGGGKGIRGKGQIRRAVKTMVGDVKDMFSHRDNQFPISVMSTTSDGRKIQGMEGGDGHYESIPHPGQYTLTWIRENEAGRSTEKLDLNGVAMMEVPKFWRPPFPLGYGHVMTKEEALKIGSKIRPPLILGNGQTVDDSDLDEDGFLETIFVAISSYRDKQCPYTVEDIFKRAKYPSRVRVGIVDQMDASAGEKACNLPEVACTEDPDQMLCKYRHQIDIYIMDAKLGVGPVFARHIGHRMYRGEYFAMQVDAHVLLTNGWDVDNIMQWRHTGNELAILSTYLSDVSSYDEKTGTSLVNTRPIMCVSDFEGGPRLSRKYMRNGQQPEGVSPVSGSPQIQPYWAAGFSFSRGHFVVNVPYDGYLPMIFQGEESNIGLRAFTYGYDSYAPEQSTCFHMYANGGAKNKRSNLKMFWEHANLYEGVEDASKDRLLGIIKMNPDVDPKTWDHTEEEKYGIGNTRDVNRFFQVYGIHVQERKIERHLCRFIEKGETHSIFVRNLRLDGMGVDYDKIDFQYHDENPEDKAIL